MGLEIHVQLNTESKLFCDCGTDYQNAGKPNDNICPTCTAQPGSKPFDINSRAVEQSLKVALALGCEKIKEEVVMQRKHYFYPDLPSNYQRTSTPIATGGSLANVSITEVHLEEDPGRYDLKTGLVDYNRAGVPLLEIVTDPVIESPEHARKFLDELSAVLGYLDAARPESSGSMRADANVSIKGHNRVEVKNINSFRGVFSALTYEISRQRNMIKNGLEVARETRHFDEDREITMGLRKKESVDDYRYFPDPDVQPVEISNGTVQKISKALPELPRRKMERFRKEYGISDDEAFALCLEQEMANGFERVAKTVDAKLAARFMRGVLKKQLNYRGWTYAQFEEKGKEDGLADILKPLQKDEITPKTAEQLLITIMDSKAFFISPGFKKSNEGEILQAVELAIKENVQAVRDYKSGTAKALHFLAGKVMALTKGKADPALVQELLKRKMAGKK